MCICGLIHPVSSAVFGAVWVVGRVVYGYGYAVGGPQGRMAGGLISHVGDFPLFAMCLKIAYGMVMQA